MNQACIPQSITRIFRIDTAVCSPVCWRLIGLAMKIAAIAKQKADEAAGIDTTPAVVAPVTPDHELHKRAYKTYEMLNMPTDSPQYVQMTALLEESIFADFDPMDTRTLG
jgi:hypothetical protein